MTIDIPKKSHLLQGSNIMTKKLCFLIFSFGLLLSWALPAMALDSGFTLGRHDPCDPNIVVYCKLNESGDPNTTPRVTNDAWHSVDDQPATGYSAGTYFEGGKDGYMFEYNNTWSANEANRGGVHPSPGDPNVAWDTSGMFSGENCLKLFPGNGNAFDSKGGGRVHVPVTWTGGSKIMHPHRGTVTLWAKQAADAPGTNTEYRYLIGFTNITGPAAYGYGSRLQLYFYTDGAAPTKSNDICVGMGDWSKLDRFIQTIATDQWYHYALTWQATDPGHNKGTYTLYVDGYDLGPGTPGDPAYPPLTYRALSLLPDYGDVGNSGSTYQAMCFYGRIDEVAFYNKVLSRDDICKLAGHDPNYAYNPSPEDKFTGISVNPTLTWSAGKLANNHVVYFGTDYSNPPAIATVTDPCYTPPAVLAGATEYGWKITELNGDTVLTSNPVVWTFTTLLNKSSIPNPANGLTNVNSDVTLSWIKSNLGTAHDVYLGTDSTSLPKVSAKQTAQNYAAGNPPTNMKLGTKYYWRINDYESGTDNLSTGDLWSFTVADYFVIDNFEYDGPTALKTVWKATGGTGAYYSCYMDPDTIFASGEGTLENTRDLQTTTISGQTRTYTTAWDYTFGGLMKAMAIWYKCDPNTNVIYVAITDGAGSPVYKKVALPYTDPNLVRDWEWNEWNIDLNDFSGCDLTKMSRIEVGVGDGTNTYGASSGNKRRWTELRLYQARWMEDQPGDVEGDHVVDFDDYVILANEYLKPAVNLVQNPNFSGSTDSCGVPSGWQARIAIAGTCQTYLGPQGNSEAPFVIGVLEEEGVPKSPCGRITLMTACTSGPYGGLAQLIDANDYIGQDLNVSWYAKGDISVTSTSIDGDDPTLVNHFWEPRIGCQTQSVLQTTGTVGGFPFREEQRGQGVKKWDWKLFTYNSATINQRYLGLYLNALSTRRDPAPYCYIYIDHVVVKTSASIIPQADLNEDNDVNFRDLAILADNWLEVTAKKPPF